MPEESAHRKRTLNLFGCLLILNLAELSRSLTHSLRLPSRSSLADDLMRRNKWHRESRKSKTKAGTVGELKADIPDCFWEDWEMSRGSLWFYGRGTLRRTKPQSKLSYSFSLGWRGCFWSPSVSKSWKTNRFKFSIKSFRWCSHNGNVKKYIAGSRGVFIYFLWSSRKCYSENKEMAPFWRIYGSTKGCMQGDARIIGRRQQNLWHVYPSIVM